LLVSGEIATEIVGLRTHAFMNARDVKKCKYNVSECILI
jgi:hypothetical protein